MITEIAVIGYPSLCGGADTELLDQLKIWSMLGIKTHIIPTNRCKNRIDISDLNTVIHKPFDFSSCSGLHTISFCNPAFLIFSNTIKRYARSTSWVNCMTFNWKNELEAHERGDIDFFLYQTKHQYEKLAGHLIKINSNYVPFKFVPYFDNSKFPYIESNERDYSKLHFGRISRADLSKFSKDQFEIYYKCNVEKQGIVLGWKSEFKRCFRSDFLNGSDCSFYFEGGISQQQFFKETNVLSMSTSTFENLPRTGFEALASGTVLVVDNRGGWKLQVDHKKTGILCNNKNDFIEAMNYLYKNPEVCKEYARNARAKLEAEFSFKRSASSWLTFFEGINKLK